MANVRSHLAFAKKLFLYGYQKPEGFERLALINGGIRQLIAVVDGIFLACHCVGHEALDRKSELIMQHYAQVPQSLDKNRLLRTIVSAHKTPDSWLHQLVSLQESLNVSKKRWLEMQRRDSETSFELIASSMCRSIQTPHWSAISEAQLNDIHSDVTLLFELLQEEDVEY